LFCVGLDHVVLCKLTYKPGSPEEVEFLKEAKALISGIPGVISVSAGSNFVADGVKFGNTGDRSHGFTHALVVRMVNKDVLGVYGPHPDHLKLAGEMIKPFFESKNTPCLLAFDLESERVKGNASTKQEWQIAAAAGWLIAVCAVGFIFTRRQ